MKYSESILALGRKQATMCNDNSVAYINCLVTCEGMRAIMVMVYNVIIHLKLSPAIENLSLEEKNFLWTSAKDFAKESINLTETIRLSKCLYALDYLLTKL